MSSQDLLRQRIANSSADAVAGYATAAVAAYVDLAGKMLGMWAGAVDTMLGSAQPKSWYRHPDHPARATSPTLGLASFKPWGMSAATPFATSVPGLAPVNPVVFWLNAWPLQGNPAAWPMAFAMMGMGVSRSVAYPLAQANTAAMDAASAASSVFEKGYASYRSDGGHASAHVHIKKGAPMAAFMPFGTAAMLPFMAAFSAFPSTL